MCVVPASFAADNIAVITEHTSQIHGQAPAFGDKFVCCICDCSAAKSRFSDWLTHIRNCVERAGRSKSGGVQYARIFDCHCGEKFVTENFLKAHLRAHLTNKQPVICPHPDCNVRIESLRTFNRHLKESHNAPVAAARVVVDVFEESDDDCMDPPAPDATVEPGGGADGNAGPSVEQPGEGEALHDRLRPSWFVSSVPGGDRMKRDCMALTLSANALFKVPKSKTRKLFALYDDFTARYLKDPTCCDIRDLLSDHCNPRVVDELNDKILKRITGNLPLRRTYDRAFGKDNLTTDYRLTREMKSCMQFVPPCDINGELTGNRGDEASCVIPKGGGMHALIAFYFRLFTKPFLLFTAF